MGVGCGAGSTIRLPLPAPVAASLPAPKTSNWAQEASRCLRGTLGAQVVRTACAKLEQKNGGGVVKAKAAGDGKPKKGGSADVRRGKQERERDAARMCG